MYAITCQINGVAPLMQHRFPVPELSDMAKGGHRSSGAKDYTVEWKDYFYQTADGDIYQPASHIEGALVTAAKQFKIQGKRGKSYGDLFKASVFVTPDQIMHGVKAPDTLTTDADESLYLDVRPVVVQRARVVRIRPCFKAGWKLDFEIQVIDDQIQDDLLNDVLILAGRSVGIGDYRPKFGRFNVSHFETHH